MSGRDKFYLTTAISYINGPPHLGHAYEAIASDVLARFTRLDGFDRHRWLSPRALAELPISTLTRKALGALDLPVPPSRNDSG